MKLIQCEIKSPVYLRGAHRGHSWWRPWRLFPSALAALQANLCMSAWENMPFQRNAAQHCCTPCIHQAFRLLNITASDISIQIQFFLGLDDPKPSEIREIRHKGQVQPPTASHRLFSPLFDSRIQSDRLEIPAQLNPDKVEAPCLSVAYRLVHPLLPISNNMCMRQAAVSLALAPRLSS